jgi:hypothetical protein
MDWMDAFFVGIIHAIHHTTYTIHDTTQAQAEAEVRWKSSI